VLLLLLEPMHFVRASAILRTFGMRFKVHLFFSLTDLLDYDFFNIAKSRFFESVIFDKPLYFLLDVIHIMYIAESDLLRLSFFSDVDLDEQFLPAVFGRRSEVEGI
jgi:hypothetical protein